MFSYSRICSLRPSSVKKLLNLRLLQTSASLQSNVAVVLAGSGVYDGSEVHEVSAVWVHLSRAGAEVSMFAPDIPQMHTVDHTKGEPSEDGRNVLKESARIARGNVKPISDLQVTNFDAVVFPGGFGAAKNLSSFAVDGTDMKVEPDVERVLKEFHSAQKPIGLCCIAPVLAAKVISGCEVTVGSNEEEGGRWPFAGTCGAIEAMGAKHVKKNVTEIHTDEANRIVTTPAFMCQTAVHEVFDGIGAMVQKVLTLIK
ncbi:glutamine amidotransferase-like class 1 domain-containing protein 3A, mitochondrial [Aplysia californica]|uniref:Glutamine amidotransferase-like class 1 domain-containing protein 3A, mitochondrial n=1 Tax=Aplysia californica TaxID=6500 RepID=A0ABM0JWT7_APLCA|nr:glutamine amidotransferase-like class 1 domain-containing protein 3A, mitochondrial [Aplysia californica]